MTTTTTRACAPHGILFQGIVAPGRRANVIEREREREELVTFLGQIPGQMWEYANTSVTYDAYGT